MCGITGVFRTDNLNGYIAGLQKANDIVYHRGPDGGGFALFTAQSLQVSCADDLSQVLDTEHRYNLGFGHRRLAILDLSDAGKQPMAHQDASLWITFNGEIYNYLELQLELQSLGYTFHSHCDTEVVLAAYDAWGEDCVNRFNGMWAFAIADLKKKKLFCSRDRFGIKPFHYFYNSSTFIFGSEIKQLLCFPCVARQSNERAIYEFLAYGAVEYNAETFFKGIFKLKQGCNLVLDLDSSEVAPHTYSYYKPDLKLNNEITIAEATEKLRWLLEDSIRLRLRSDVEVGSCLSGGLDSSTIVCLVRQILLSQNKSELQKTFSSHFEEKEANELEYMQEVINATGVKAAFIYPNPKELLQDLEKLVWHQEEPFGSTSIFAQWSVYKLVGQHDVKVMLDGQGADEQLAGYLGLGLYFLQELWTKKQYLKFVWESLQRSLLQRTLYRDVSRNLLKQLRKVLPFAKLITNFGPIDWIQPNMANKYQHSSDYLANFQIKPFGDQEILSNTLYQLTFSNNLQSLLKYEDRNSMAFSVEARVPFVDYRLVEFLSSLPSHMKIRDGYSKRVLRDAIIGLVPEKIRTRISKLGFATPESAWQAGVLKPLIEEAISSEVLQPFLVKEQAQAYVKSLEQNQVIDFTPWRWVSVYLWHQTFIKEVGSLSREK
jgi:asparagine synthase (glutamine-hydrolysing)